MRVKVWPIVAWYDLWVGAYWDRKAKRLYLLPIPCIGLVVGFREPEQNDRPGQDL